MRQTSGLRNKKIIIIQIIRQQYIKKIHFTIQKGWKFASKSTDSLIADYKSTTATQSDPPCAERLEYESQNSFQNKDVIAPESLRLL